MNKFENHDENNPVEYFAANFPEILHLFLLSPEPSIEELDWLSPKHKEVALDFEEVVEDETIIDLGVHLWYQYCLQQNPKVIKTSVYSAALLYLIDQLNPFGGYLTQKELAEDFQISASSLSARYRDMEKVLHKEIQEIMDGLENIDVDDILTSILFDEDEDFFDDEDDFFDDEDPFLDELKMGNQTTEPIGNLHVILRDHLNQEKAQQGELTDKEKAQEMLLDAYETTGINRKKLAEKALKLYPNSPDAYTILAEFEMNPMKEEKLFLKAMKAGETDLGQDFFKENIGHFWEIISTRPYMRAKKNYAILLQETGRLDEAIKHYEELLELNPIDNQGVRYELFTALVEKGLLKKAEALLYTFNQDSTANGTYNSVLIEFLQNGATSKAKQLLQKAKQQNPYVPDYLLGRKGIPLCLPNVYQLGEKSEAFIYADQHLDLWKKNKTLIDWLKKNK